MYVWAHFFATKKLIPNKVTKFVWDYGSYHLFLELVSDELTTQKKKKR